MSIWYVNLKQSVISHISIFEIKNKHKLDRIIIVFKFSLKIKEIKRFEWNEIKIKIPTTN